jgi:membrane protease YdiL (CAAX protease family)
VNPFYNHRENRLRAFWRLLFQFALNTVGATLVGSLALVLFAVYEGADLADSSVETLTTSTGSLAVGFVASAVPALVSVWLAGRFFDRRPFSDFGLRLDRSWWLDLCFGLALGALLMTGIFFVELAAGWIAITGSFEVVGSEGSFPLVILVPFVVFVCVGFYEELVSRGYQLTNIAEGLNYPRLGPRSATLLAWVLSSSIFGLLHLANPNATIISSINIAFAGLLLGIGYVLTGRLAIPIGLHITWNFFQGNVFGFPVSGIEPIGATFLSIEQGGPLLFTGGPFGPEAGLLEPAATLVGTLLIWLWVRTRYGKATLETSIAEPPIEISKSTRGNPPDTLAPGNSV